jgi:hypothetical protein
LEHRWKKVAAKNSYNFKKWTSFQRLDDPTLLGIPKSEAYKAAPKECALSMIFV